MSDDISKKKLGRGLSALLGDDMASDYADLDKVRSTKEVPVEQLRANQYQPRLDWDQEALSSLAASIAEKGILQPILVRRNPTKDSEYEIVAGERRWRAAQMAQLHQVPVIIKEMTDAESMEIALIENIQREDLSSIEEAEAYRRLMTEFNHTQESLAQHVGKSRAHVANIMRLLTLPRSVQRLVRDGSLAAGAARALINHDNAEKLAEKIVAEGLSVRAAEKLAQCKKIDINSLTDGSGPPGKMARKFAKEMAKSADVRALEYDLSAALGMEVDIDHMADGHGLITIRYANLDQLDDACRRLTREPLHVLREIEEDPLEDDWGFDDSEYDDSEPDENGYYPNPNRPRTENSAVDARRDAPADTDET